MDKPEHWVIDLQIDGIGLELARDLTLEARNRLKERIGRNGGVYNATWVIGLLQIFKKLAWHRSAIRNTPAEGNGIADKYYTRAIWIGGLCAATEAVRVD